MVDEFSIIDLLKEGSMEDNLNIIKGIGDDAAVIKHSSNKLVTSVDTFVEDIHFSDKTMSPEDIAYKAIAANVSDIVAMGGTAKYYLLSLALPKNISTSFIHQFKEGLRLAEKAYNLHLIGGDTVEADKLIVSITAIGFIEYDYVRYRHLAKPGDIVFVTGYLGDSSYGLNILQNDIKMSSEYFVKRHQRPHIRTDFPKISKAIKRIALNDISDGIANELYEICEASNVSITIEDDLLPVHDEINALPSDDRNTHVLFGGEDFELIGTVAAEYYDELANNCYLNHIPITKIGRVSYNEEDLPKVYIKKNGQKEILNKLGYHHLK